MRKEERKEILKLRSWEDEKRGEKFQMNVQNKPITQITQTIKKAWITQMTRRLGETERKEVLKLGRWEKGREKKF